MNLASGIGFSLIKTRHEHIHVGSDAAVRAAYGLDQTESDSFRDFVCQNIDPLC